MKIFFAAAIFTLLFSNAQAFTEGDAAKLVKAYSKTVACGVEESKYQAIQISGTPGDSFMGDSYLVLWSGDFGCSGGNASIFPQFTVVEIREHSTPVVIPDYKVPSIDMTQVTKITYRDKKVILEGIVNTGDPKRPTKKSTQVFKVTGSGEITSAKQ